MTKRAKAAADVHDTRRLLLETAGALFAEKGFERVTGKEICRGAGAGPAAVTRHFGGMAGLREEVVREAHRRVVTVEAVAAAAGSSTDPKEQLRAIVRVLVASFTGLSDRAWAVRVVSREIAAGSPTMERLSETELLPIQRIVRRIVAAVTGRPLDDPVVARGCVTVLGPCFMLLVADRRTLAHSIPGLRLGPGDAEEIARQFADSALAGLEIL